jgi:DNA ligase 1
MVFVLLFDLCCVNYINSIRFPRLVRERDDKTPEQATTADQILDMYNSQDCIKNNAAFTAEMNGQDDDDDDFL